MQRCMVSPQEMMRMREEGMSNYEIAKSLDIAPVTVLRNIGKQPKGMRAPYGSRTAEKRRREAPPIVKEEEFIPASLVLESRVFNLVGAAAKYRVDDKIGTVQITVPDGTQMELKFEDVDNMIKELQAIRRKVCASTPMEAW